MLGVGIEHRNDWGFLLFHASEALHPKIITHFDPFDGEVDPSLLGDRCLDPSVVGFKTFWNGDIPHLHAFSEGVIEVVDEIGLLLDLLAKSAGFGNMVDLSVFDGGCQSAIEGGEGLNVPSRLGDDKGCRGRPGGDGLGHCSCDVFFC